MKLLLVRHAAALAGTGRLIWFLPPLVLRALAGAVGILRASPAGGAQAAARRNVS